MKEKGVLTLKQFPILLILLAQILNRLSVHTTNKVNSSFRRIICHHLSKTGSHESSDLPLLVLVQYATISAHPVEKPPILPYGNATKATRLYTSTVSKVLEHLRVGILDNS